MKRHGLCHGVVVLVIPKAMCVVKYFTSRLGIRVSASVGMAVWRPFKRGADLSLHSIRQEVDIIFDTDVFGAKLED